MMTLGQSVINDSENSTLFFNGTISTETYMNGLLKTLGKKNMASMARESGYDCDVIAAALKKKPRFG